MNTYRNDSGSSIAFRDDAPGKHFIEPGETFVLTGEQHAPVVEGLGAVPVTTPPPVPADATKADLQAAAKRMGLDVPSGATKDELRAAVDAVTGNPAVAEGEPVQSVEGMPG